MPFLMLHFNQAYFVKVYLIECKFEPQSIALTIMKFPFCSSSQSPPRHLPSFCLSLFAIACMLVVLSVRPAFADELADARALANSGKYAEALTITENFLTQKPNDAKMLFLKGLILTEQNQTAKAIAVFTKLTEDQPGSPEAYNNLAALYASSGQYDKARTALEAAIRTNPAYATAFENLGDVYAKLASQAYDKALQTNISNSSQKPKLAMVNSLGGVTVMAKVSPPVVVATKPVVEATPPVASASVAPPAKAEPKPAVKQEAGSNADRDEIAKTLTEWAAAWSSKDVKKYLSYYANDFQTPKGMSRKAWSDERQARIVGKGRISVKVESPQITISGNTATAKFRQAYSSDRLSVSSKKTMIFTKSGGKWKIQQELAN